MTFHQLSTLLQAHSESLHEFAVTRRYLKRHGRQFSRKAIFAALASCCTYMQELWGFEVDELHQLLKYNFCVSSCQVITIGP